MRTTYITCEVSGCTFHSMAKYKCKKQRLKLPLHCIKAYNPEDHYLQKLKFPPSNDVKVEHLNVKVLKQDLLYRFLNILWMKWGPKMLILISFDDNPQGYVLVLVFFIKTAFCHTVIHIKLWLALFGCHIDTTRW